MSGLPLDLFEQPWAIEPSRLSRLVAQQRLPEAERAAAMPQMDGSSRAMRAGPVSVVPIVGVLTHRPGLESLFGLGTSVEEVRRTLRAELNDPSVRAVILDIDSPGGTVAGIPELAAEIRGRRGGNKRIIAVANTTAASAAFWLGAQADELIVTPSGQVGSVGIYAVHQEQSRHLESEGITTTVIGVPDAKTDANEWQPLSTEARDHIQSRADQLYGQFVSDLALGRRVPADVVESRYGGGRMLLAKQAKSAGMVDGIATLDATIARVFAEVGGTTRPTMRMRAEVPGYEMADATGPVEEAEAIPAKETDTDAGAWDGPANESRLPSGEGAGATLREAYAWVDPDGDPNVKASYRFIHHEVSAGGDVGPANLTACSAGIAVLNGARGGTTIPEADIPGVHAHLGAHLMDAKRDVPPMAASFTSRLDSLAAEAEELLEHARERARLRAKEGRPLYSTTTESALRSIHDATGVFLGLADPAPVATGPAVDPPAPAPDQAPVVPSNRRFRTDEDWARYIEGELR